MEKKRNQLARNGQNNSDFYTKKSQDVSNKQQYTRRRKEGNFQEFGNSKNRGNNSNNNFYFDKRPSASRNNRNEPPNALKSTSETTRLTSDGDELNSVYNHGSKKQNLNHLLNFHKYTKETDGYGGAFSKYGYQHYFNRSKRYNYNKEQYLQANCQFVVKEDTKFDYRPFKISPDTLVEWDQVVKVLISSCEESQCPICLYPPKAAKMTKCGHIYCFSCMLHYLSLSDKSWRKCPICYEAIQLNDLKSSSSKHIHQSYKVGDIINMELMKRERGSLFVNKVSDNDEMALSEFPNFTDINDNFTFSKLIMANKHEILKIIDGEMNELDFQLAEDGFDCPESIFIQQAIELLKAKRETLIDEEENVTTTTTSSLSEVLINVDLDSSHEHEDGDDLIDEDSDLTVNDIDIVPITSKNFFFYQAQNGQNVFLHSLNSKMLQMMYGSVEESPKNIRGKILQISSCTMNEDLRKRLKYLQHLPVSSVFEIVEIEFEHGFLSKDVFDVFKDDIFQRHKRRQRREREEKKRERAIDEINDRQMGKMLSSSINIDIGSTAQFPEYDNNVEMPPLTSNVGKSKKATAGPSYSTMLTSPTARKSEKLWPSLASNNNKATSSFFGNDVKKFSSTTSSSTMKDIKNVEESDEANSEDDADECKAPVYKNSLSDALVNALKTASLGNNNINSNENVSGGGKKNNKKKKTKKTLLFSSGMNFN